MITKYIVAFFIVCSLSAADMEENPVEEKMTENQFLELLRKFAGETKIHLWNSNKNRPYTPSDLLDE